jgi:hypothetical protein
MDKSVVIDLHALTEGNLIAPLALASGACSGIEFGHAVLAGSPLHHTFGFPNDEMTFAQVRLGPIPVGSWYPVSP